MGDAKMIKLGEAKKALEKVMSSACELIGFFRHSSLVWVRSTGTDQFLLVGLRQDARGYYAMSISAAIRLEAISKLLEGSPTHGIHINVPIHLLPPCRKFEEWQFRDIGQLETLKATILDELEERVIPFFIRCGTLEAVRVNLRSESPKDWFTLNPEQRIELLAAIEATLGNRAVAAEIIKNALIPLRDAPPKKRYSLEALDSKLTVMNCDS